MGVHFTIALGNQLWDFGQHSLRPGDGFPFTPEKSTHIAVNSLQIETLDTIFCHTSNISILYFINKKNRQPTHDEPRIVT